MRRERAITLKKWNSIQPSTKPSIWVIKNTNSNHSQNLRAKRLTKRVMKFINQTGHTQSVMTHINEDRNRARLFDDE